MEGLTKKRFTVWMVLFVLLILLAGGGIGSHFMGYGKSGEVRKEVSPIIDRYNKLTAVVALNASEETKMKANLTSDGIQVTYVGKNGPSKTKFVYKTDGNFSIGNLMIWHESFKKIPNFSGCSLDFSLYSKVLKNIQKFQKLGKK